jgi:hypothetical protein
MSFTQIKYKIIILKPTWNLTHNAILIYHHYDIMELSTVTAILVVWNSIHSDFPNNSPYFVVSL